MGEEGGGPRTRKARSAAGSLQTLKGVTTCLFLCLQVFPFFTYIPSGGFLGAGLARALFFIRIGSDIIGRFAPRFKSIVTRSQGVLFSLAMCQVRARMGPVRLSRRAPRRFKATLVHPARGSSSSPAAPRW